MLFVENDAICDIPEDPELQLILGRQALEYVAGVRFVKPGVNVVITICCRSCMPHCGRSNSLDISVKQLRIANKHECKSEAVKKKYHNRIK